MQARTHLHFLWIQVILTVVRTTHFRFFKCLAQLYGLGLLPANDLFHTRLRCSGCALVGESHSGEPLFICGPIVQKVFWWPRTLHLRMQRMHMARPGNVPGLLSAAATPAPYPLSPKQCIPAVQSSRIQLTMMPRCPTPMPPTCKLPVRRTRQACT